MGNQAVHGPDREITNMDQTLAVPRKNGELQFEAPWEARAFGLALALHEEGVYEWGDFSGQLATEIGQAEQSREESTYYERWLRALEAIAKENSLLTEEELEKKASEVASADDHHHHDHAHHHSRSRSIFRPEF